MQDTSEMKWTPYEIFRLRFAPLKMTHCDRLKQKNPLPYGRGLVEIFR